MYSKTRLPQPLLRVLRESSRPFPFSPSLPLSTPSSSFSSFFPMAECFPISFPLRWRALSALVTISLTVKSKPCHDWARQAGLSEETWLTDCLTITLGNWLQATQAKAHKTSGGYRDLCIKWLCAYLHKNYISGVATSCFGYLRFYLASRRVLTKDVDLIMKTGRHILVFLRESDMPETSWPPFALIVFDSYIPQSKTVVSFAVFPPYVRGDSSWVIETVNPHFLHLWFTQA